MGFEALLSVFWNVDPVALRLGPVTIKWYGVLFASGFLLGYLFMWRVFIREGKPQEDLDKLLLTMLVSTMIGARLGHCLFYEPGYYLANPLRMLAFWSGGLASHGAAIGIAIGLYLYSRKRPGQPYLWVFDRIVIPTAIAGAMIRLGNLFNSEILGAPADVPWAFVFARVDEFPRHPVQLYESIAYAIVFVVLLVVYLKLGAKTPRGLLLGLFFVMVFTARFFLEFFKVRQASYDTGLPLSVGQLLSIPAVLVGVGLLVYAARLHRNAYAL